MNARLKMQVTGLAESDSYRKFAIAFVFMSLVPIVLLVFIIHHLNITEIAQEKMPYFRLTILLVVLLSLASFDLIRRSLLSLKQLDGYAKEIAEGNYKKRLDDTQRDDMGRLARSFNKITSELENKIVELESSKRLLHNILEKVGTAVTSTRGITNLMELILQSMVQGAEATSGAIFLLDSDSSKMNMEVSFEMEKGVQDVNIMASEGLIGRVAQLKKIETVSNVDTNAAAYFEFKKSIAKENIMAAPLLVHNEKVLGVMVICDKKTQESFTSDDIMLLGNVATQTAIAIENYQLNEDAEKTYLETITALAVAVEAKDTYSRGHIDRVAGYVEKLGRQMKLDEEIMKTLRNGATLHDVGKIGVRDGVLRKQGPLTEDERKEMEKHCVIGVNIIKPIKSMSALCDLVRHHQEFYDGTGYPDGLKGEEIPLTARIIKVCDAYDAMTTDRPYRKGMSKEDAKKELLKKGGIEFDPAIVEAFIKVI